MPRKSRKLIELNGNSDAVETGDMHNTVGIFEEYYRSNEWEGK